ncbi:MULTISPECIES: branched-chain amino acid aminotransferase [Flavobacterium]|jgi:branched-chain amino acid aminotransferase|uniref:Branched-chain-amino-acid aminotransferase n=1 Tax=Flavobacterium lindanitolerans TaxID=428988 RepID=A0A497U9U6_9FLAO|nr:MULTISPECIES: branched-chain amino acid aminotransferase [Flavobacterium]PZO34164.1 MAG: branched-chain amino acid aminotransferase [Flavobacteriaceae bacterium]KQS47787.1 branched-chain amino acid aminotransferase [Flavobacterium sp. Leaf359]MBC8644964.1 branched-chain amino acid aminotransferase [Flavobacterium lindanitolerans]MBL7868630.1 branched-chain amino acid aminotransferase [Flavobacterium lindanitolerans]MDQ7961292.1 branched-chain amino acid aminotransferase [Flavobacterium lind
MNLKNNPEIDIIRASSTKINDVDFENLVFGNIFTDHMLVCDYKDGKWQKPVIRPYEPFLLDPSAKVFHYGQAIFEGMKAYKDNNDDVWLFRPDENFDRFNKSAVRMAMPEVPEEVFLGGLHEILKIEKDWVKKGKGNTLYIRPFMIATGTGVVAAPSSQYRFMIILSPAKSYYSGEVKVIIAEHYSRAANGGIGAAKAAGNYSAQFYPTQLANKDGFQQIIWTDDATHTKLEEAGTMNVFFRINNTLFTAPASERILDGVTRKSLITLAEKEGIDIQVRSVLVWELVEAAKNGTLKEIFGAGTAAVVNPIVGFSYKGEYFELPKVEDSIALQLKEKLTNIQYKLAEDPFDWTVKI